MKSITVHMFPRAPAARRRSHEWSAAPWMDKLGLTRKYALTSPDTVTVKEAGLYYVYAQVSRRHGHAGTGVLFSRTQSWMY